MKRFRKMLRRGWKPVALAFVAVTLALSLTVTTTQKAEANPLLVPPLLLASGTMPVGSALGLVSLTGPIGWGIIGLGALAVGLAVTQDYWLPYVTGDFGDSKPADVPVHTDILNTNQTIYAAKILDANLDGGNSVRVLFDGTGRAAPTQNYSILFGLVAQCQRNTDGYVAYSAKNVSSGIVKNTTPYMTWTYTTPCGAGWTMKGFKLGGGQGGGAGSWLPNITGSTSGATFAGGAGGTSNWVYGSSNIVSYGETFGGLPAFNPETADTKYKSTVECVRPDGTFFNIDAESTGADGGVKMASCEKAFPGAHGTGKTDVVGYPPGSTVPETLWSNPRLPTSDEYPLCGPSRPGPMCSLAVTVDGKPCVDAVGSWNCTHWRDIANLNEARVQCSYGPYSGLAVDVCNPMERAYELGGVIATEPNLDGDPSTRNDSSPSGEPYSKPQINTGTGTGTSTFPSTGTNPGTEPGPDNENCLATGWSWDPVSWVMVPVQCALQWAFVPPRARLDATVEAIKPKIEAKGIEPFIIPFMENFGNLGGSGCQGPAISLNSIGLNRTLYPFDACTEPLAPIASGVNAFFSLSIILQGGTSCIRAAAAAFGFNWGLGVGGKDED